MKVQIIILFKNYVYSFFIPLIMESDFDIKSKILDVILERLQLTLNSFFTSAPK
jgi:hypothetical protein